MSRQRNEHIQDAVGRFATAVVCTFFVVFLVRRAIRVSLTYDEAASYLKFVNADLFSLFNFTWATNHFLNTVLVRFFHLFGGDHELTLRIPSLLGYGIYFAFSVLILRGLSSRVLALAGLLLLNLNPYVLDYFALSRGYGLWLGLQMAMLYYLLRFTALLRATRFEEANRALSRALLCAAGAVLANFAALNVYVALVLVALIAFVVFNRRSAAPAAATVRRWSTMPRTLLWIGIATFAALVFSQDLRLSPQLYEHIVVRLDGIGEADAPAARILATDLHNRQTELQRRGVSWVSGRVETTGLRIDAPVVVAEKIRSIETTIGDRTFTGPAVNWTRRDVDGIRTFESAPSLSLPRSGLTTFQPIINFHGGREHALYAIGHAAAAMLVVALFGIAMTVAGVGAARLGLVGRDQWRVIADHAVVLAGIVVAPMYLLVRDGELGFGDVNGLGQAARNLVDALFYDHVYAAGQAQVAITVVGGLAIACTVALAVNYRRLDVGRIVAALTALSIVAVVTAIVIAERLLVNSPYPLGRTALFFVPLCLVVAILAFDALADASRSWRAATHATLIAAAVLAAVHFSRTANVRSTEDWPYDVDTRAMIGDLARFVAAQHPAKASVNLLVYPMYSASAAVYAEWNKTARISVVEETPAAGADYLYFRAWELPPNVHVMKEYPAAGGALAQAR